MKNLVITSAFNYGPEVLVPFLESTSRVCKNTEVAIITTAKDAESLRQLQSTYPFLKFFVIPKIPARPFSIEKITAIRTMIKACRRVKLILMLLMNSKFGFKPSVGIEKANPFGLSTLHLNIINRRHFPALELLRRYHQSELRCVMLADIRDVVLQSDPFPYVDSGCYTGEENCTISENSYNAEWVRDAYGSEMLSALSKMRILCAGVTIGRRDSIMSYLEEMCRETLVMMRQNYKEKYSFLDQALHNKLIRIDGLECKIVPCNGFISTVGLVEPERILVNERGLLEVDGHIPAVVHQYDRHPEIASKLERHYKRDLKI